MHHCHHPRHHINVSPNILSVAHFRLPRFQSEEVEFHVFLLFSFFKHGNFHHWVTHSVQDAWRLRTESQNISQGNWRLLWRVLSDSPEPATAFLHRCRYLSCFAQCSPVSCCSLTLSNCCIPGDKQSLPLQTLPYSNILFYFTKRKKQKKRSFPIITQTIKQTKLSLIWNCFTLFLNEEQRYHVSHLVCAMCTHTVDGHNKLTKPLNIYGCTSKWYPWVKANKKHANFLLLDCSKMPFHKLLRL